MRRPYSKDPVVERSLRHSVRDAAAHSVMAGSGESYFSAFALFLKATTSQIALLASLPPLLASLAQVLSVWCGRFVHQRKSMILVGAFLQCFLWLPLLALPLVFSEYAVPLFIVLVVVYQASGNFVAPQWSSWMGDLVPARKRGRYFGMRTRCATITSFTALVVAGSILHWFDGRGATVNGFILIFAVAAIARMVSAYHLSHMYEPPRAVEPPSVTFDRRAWGRRLRHSSAVRFSVFFCVMQATVYIASPFFAVYMLRDLKFSYLEFMTVSAMSVFMHFISLRTWGRISDVYGNRVILALTCSLITVLPLLWLVSTNFWFLVGAQMVSGMCWSGFNLATNNFLFDSVPAEKRSQYMAFHNVLTAVGVFSGAMLGGYLASVLPTELAVGGMHFNWATPLYGVFLLSALARMTAASSFLRRIKEVKHVRRRAPRHLVTAAVFGVARRATRLTNGAREVLRRTGLLLVLFVKDWRRALGFYISFTK